MESENRQKNKTKYEVRQARSQVLKRIRQILCAIFIVVLALFASLYIYCKGIGADYKEAVSLLFSGRLEEFEGVLNPEKYMEADVVEGFVQNEHPDESDKFVALGETLFKVSDNSIVQYTSTGIIAKETRVDMSESRIHKSGKYMVVYSIGEQMAYMVTEEKLISISLPDPVLVATIGYGGYMAFVLEADNYMSAVAIYNEQGQNISTRYIQNDAVVWAGVSPDNTYYCINRISLGDLQASSYLEYNRMGEVSAYAMESYPGTLIASCSFAQNGTMVAVADNKLIHIGVSRKPISEIEVTAIHAMTQSPEGDVLVSAQVKESGEHVNRVYIFGRQGDSTFFNTDLAVTSISAVNQRICAVIGTGAILYDYSGKVLTSFFADTNKISDAILYKDSYLLIYKTTVDKRKY